MTIENYFDAATTACTIPQRGAHAVYCGEKPRTNKDGLKTYSLRGPLLIMPMGMWNDEAETMEKVARILNDHAHEFFDSAKPEAPLPDDLAVDAFAAAMKAKLAAKRAQGYGGWDSKTDCSGEELSQLLRNHVHKGDPLDVGNFAMMLHQRGETITTAPDRVIEECGTCGGYGYADLGECIECRGAQSSDRKVNG